MIKFSHTIFALPFALSGGILALKVSSFDGVIFLWIILAMIGARTAAMAFNRLIDAKIDKLNPRTQNREIPSGKVSRLESIVSIFLSIGLFVFSAYRLNMLCFYLSPVAIIVILGYSYTKRFTYLCHLVLGLGLSLAPIGSWLAVTGEFAALPIILGLAVLFWVAGFDIIYSCQDYDYDKENNLKSLPVLLGLKKSLLAARIFHSIAFSLLFFMYLIDSFHFIYLIGLGIVAIILIYEHRLVKAERLENVAMAFFNMNGTISILYLIIIILNHFLSEKTV